MLNNQWIVGVGNTPLQGGNGQALRAWSWLVRRECWEHRFSLFWLPALLAAWVPLLAAVALVAWGLGAVPVMVWGPRVDAAGVLEAPSVLQALIVVIATPLAIAWVATAWSYCGGALFDDRQDKSVYFWRALPFTDGQTVASKVALVLGVAPALSLMALSLAFGLALGILAPLWAMQGGDLGAWLATGIRLLADAWAQWPRFILTALPAVAWALWVSAHARRAPLLWIVLVPSLIFLVLAWLGTGSDLGMATFVMRMGSEQLVNWGVGFLPGLAQNTSLESLLWGLGLAGGLLWHAARRRARGD